MWIKICGILTIEAALCCADAGADAIGLVFAESRRNISVKTAGKIIEALPAGVKKVGVFMDLPQKEVADIDNFLKLDLLQFHGNESPSYCSFFPGKAIKSFRVAAPGDLEAIKAYRGKIQACLLDSLIPGQAGGTGKSWNWSIFKDELAKRLCGIPLIVAGGLNANNVTTAMQELKPFGVDSSSGVECNGQKDPALVKEYIEKVRRWEHASLAQ